MDQLPPGADLTKTPAGKPPPGVTPNFNDPPSLANATIAVAVVMMGLTMIFITVRLSAIVFLGKKAGIDDYFAFIAAASASAFAGVIIALTNTARHTWDLTLAAILSPSYAKLIFAQNILQAPAVFFAKASILFLYLRVFTVKRSMRYFIYGGIVFTTALYWVHVPLVGYFCTPRNGGWSLMNMLKCTKLTVWGPIQGFCALMLDIYIFILPFPVVNQLHLQHKKKIGVMLLFSTAVFGILASTLAEVYRFKLYFDSSDSNWRQFQVFICVMVEGFIAIIVSSMPTTASFFKSNAGSSHGSGIVSSVRSRFFSRHGGSGLRSGKKISSNTSSSGGTKRSYTDSNAHPRDSTYLELKDVPSTQPIAYSNGPNRDIKEGVIEKKVVINQASYR